MQPDVSIIIVTYNALDLIDTCLDAIDQDSSRICTVEIIVVDNSSTDQTVAHVRERWPQVQLVESGGNLGMAAGNNAGMQVARGDYMLLLNSDAFLDAGAIDAMVDALKHDKKAALVGPRLSNVDGSLQRSIRGFPSTWRYATEYLFVRRIAPHSRWANAMYGAHDPHDVARSVEWLSGAVMMVRRRVVEAVGLMNENFFMFGEEVEWQHRMHEAGLNVLFAPAAGCVHVGGGSTRRTWGRMYVLQVVNHVRYMAIVHGRGAARRTRRVVLAGLWLRRLLFRGERRTLAMTAIRAVHQFDLDDVDASFPRLS